MSFDVSLLDARSYDAIYASPDEDLELLKHPMYDLDAVVPPDGGPIRLKLAEGNLLSKWWTSGDREKRLRTYIEQAYIDPPAFPNKEKAKQFYSRLKNLGKIFDQAKVGLSVYRDLSPELDRAYKEHQAAKAALLGISTFEKRLRKRQADYQFHVEWAKISGELGVPTVSAGSGVNGASFVRFQGKTVLVKKTESEDRRPKWKTEWIVGESTQPQICEHDPRKAGAVASMADQFFSFGLVPLTSTDDRGFSYQEFIPDSEDASQARLGSQKTLLRDRDPHDFTPKEMELLQVKAIFNYLTGDLDGKDDKLRLRVNDRGEIIELFETDNDNTFPAKELTSNDAHTIAKNQWKNHRWAALPFKITPRLRAIFSNISSEASLSKFAAQVADKYPDFWTRDRMVLLRQRAAIIKMCIQKGYSPFELGTIYAMEVLQEPGYSEELATVNKILDSPAELILPSADDYAARFARGDEDRKEEV